MKAYPEAAVLVDNSEERALPCIKRTWCVMPVDHDGGCVEVPRYAIGPGDFGPTAAKARRW
jgi:hypothetical protein